MNTHRENHESKEHLKEEPHFKILEGEELRAVLSQKDLHELVDQYVEETYHHPENLIKFFRAKIFDNLTGIAGFFSKIYENRLSWGLLDKHKYISLKNVKKGRLKTAQEMLVSDWLYGIEVGGQVVSIAGYKPFPEGTLDGRFVPEVRSVFTRKEFRKRGFSRKLLKPLIEKLSAIGHPIFLSTESESMIKIAQEFGFREMNEDTLKQNFSESFRDYIHVTTHLGYKVFFLFPSKGNQVTSD